VFKRANILESEKTRGEIADFKRENHIGLNKPSRTILYENSTPLLPDQTDNRSSYKLLQNPLDNNTCALVLILAHRRPKHLELFADNGCIRSMKDLERGVEVIAPVDSHVESAGNVRVGRIGGGPGDDSAVREGIRKIIGDDLTNGVLTVR
jgi:hypothetical protein